MRDLLLLFAALAALLLAAERARQTPPVAGLAESPAAVVYTEVAPVVTPDPWWWD
jgi:hypothetical protein